MTVNPSTRLTALLVGLAPFVVLSGTAVLSAGQPSASPSRHALLIGATKYPNLAEQYQLTGPINDVALVRSTLLDRLQFTRDRIVELTEANDAAGRPTRANIEREFARLTRSVGRGDHVLILFAGHGSQQPDDDPPGEDEDDGLDEIFLPADAAGWDGVAGTVQNAVVDDEIATWVAAIRNRGAFVWLVFDACQSSTLTRGGAERYRQVPASVLVPADVLDKARGTTRGAAAAESGVMGLEGNAGGIAALYAAQTTEPTPEKRLPDSNGPVHGLFTFTLIEVLNQSTGPISYRDLAERVTERYRALGRSGPTPGFEGGGLDNSVLDMASWAGRPRLLIGEKNEERLTLRAGTIHGLTRGTILRIRPPAGSTDVDRVIGHVRVVQADPTSAIVEPVAFGGIAAPDSGRLVPNSRGEVALFNYGEQVLKVALSPDVQSGDTVDSVNATLEQLSKTTNGLAEKASSVEAAHWIARVVNGEVILSSSSGWRIDPKSSETPDAQAPFRVARADSTSLGDELARTLMRIARARGLMQLAVVPPAAASDVDVDIELIRYENDQDRTGAPVPNEGGGRVLHTGDRIAFRLRNTGKTTADVTLLFIDSQYGITALFPRRDAESDSRLARNAEVTTWRMTVTDDTVGLEQVVALAVQASTPRVDFRYLEQPSLQIAQTRGGGQGDSPLQQLLNRAMYGQGTTRGLGDSDIGRHAIRMLTWRTERRPQGPSQ